VRRDRGVRGRDCRNGGNGGASLPPPDWDTELRIYLLNEHWDRRRLGPPPGHAGCRVPSELLAAYFPNGKPAYGPSGPHAELYEPVSYLDNARLDEIAPVIDSERPKSDNRTEGASWNDPDWSILDDRRGELPQFPIDVLTPPWQELVRLTSRGAGVRADHVVVPLLGMASSLIGISRRVRAVSSWSEPMSLWIAVVGASGDRKTPGLRVSLRALDFIEKNNVAAINAARLAHATRVQKSREANKKWLEDRQAALDANPPRDPPPMPIEAIDPGNFIAPRLYVTDPTIERLGELLDVRPRGMLLVRDELSGLFANMGRYSGGSDRAFWLEAHNGGRQVVERRSRSIEIPHLLVGVIGGFQPDKLARAFAGDQDGMSGRFLYGWPSTPDYHPLSNEASDVEPELQSALTALIRLPSEDAEGVFGPKDILLSDGALERFEEFRRLVDVMKRSLDGLEQQWLVKSEMQVLRLAGTLTYMAWSIALGTSSSAGIEMITAALEPQKIDNNTWPAPSDLSGNTFGLTREQH
jgi:Protein of unknown function (DUF3987)